MTLCYVPVLVGYIWYFVAGQPREYLLVLILANTVLLIANFVLSVRRRGRAQVAKYTHVDEISDIGADEPAAPDQRAAVGPSRPRP